jgi:LysM repeat protein
MKGILFFAASLTVNILFAQTSSVNYVVKSGDDLSKIAHANHISLSQLEAANPQLKGTTIKLGQTLKIPYSPTSTSSPSPVSTVNNVQPSVHVVEKGETLSSISRDNNVKLSDLEAWNHISDGKIEIGQKLIISGLPVATTIVKTDSVKPHVILKPDTNSRKIAINFDSIRKARQTPVDTSNITYSSDISGDQLHGSLQKGIATWTKDQSDGGNYFALSSDAPVGTMVIVKNLMNDKTIRVKVIGKLPDTDKAENSIIKISYSAAKAMDVLDDRFLVQLIYPTNN